MASLDFAMAVRIVCVPNLHDTVYGNCQAISPHGRFDFSITGRSWIFEKEVQPPDPLLSPYAWLLFIDWYVFRGLANFLYENV